MIAKMRSALVRLGMEPPFRVFVRSILGKLPVSARTRAVWELSKRPAYLLGVCTAADEARKQGVPAISVVEFGVAGGVGLLALQAEAEAVERETGVIIRVFGFDAGPEGLPEFIGDYRDHPDAWRPGDFPMDERALRARLTERTTLVLGNVSDTVPTFFDRFHPDPIGFVSIDLDLYSSTKRALRVLLTPGCKMLRHVPIYFDDIEFLFNHKYAGELLAINEFNAESESVKIDKWYGIKQGRPFPERAFLEKMYVAHDLEAISKTILHRAEATLPLADSSLSPTARSRLARFTSRTRNPFTPAGKLSKC